MQVVGFRAYGLGFMDYGPRQKVRLQLLVAPTFHP